MHPLEGGGIDSVDPLGVSGTSVSDNSRVRSGDGTPDRDIVVLGNAPG